MTKEQIIKSAKEKGFTSKVLFNNPYKYSHNENMRWLFWLTELQKWFRDNHKINIEITRFPNIEKWGIVITDMTIKPNSLSLKEALEMTMKVVVKEKYNTYDQALEAGCAEALNLI